MVRLSVKEKFNEAQEVTEKFCEAQEESDSVLPSGTRPKRCGTPRDTSVRVFSLRVHIESRDYTNMKHNLPQRTWLRNTLCVAMRAVCLYGHEQQQKIIVISHTYRPPLPSRRYLWYSFLLEAESTTWQ